VLVAGPKLWPPSVTPLLALALAHNRDGVGGLDLTDSDFVSLVSKIAILVVVGVSALMMFRNRFWQALQSALVWLVIALALSVIYTYRFELRAIGDRVLAEMIPGHPVQIGRTVELVRGHSGDFQISTQVNGARIAMVLDTGASAVMLTQEAAKAAGLPLEVLAYTVDIDTANGRTHAARVTLDRIAIGNIVEHAVPALVAQSGHLKESLLGMSFLNRLESWEVRGDKLLLHAPQ